MELRWSRVFSFLFGDGVMQHGVYTEAYAISFLVL
jgi:hypothetical protein